MVKPAFSSSRNANFVAWALPPFTLLVAPKWNVRFHCIFVGNAPHARSGIIQVLHPFADCVKQLPDERMRRFEFLLSLEIRQHQPDFINRFTK